MPHGLMQFIQPFHHLTSDITISGPLLIKYIAQVGRIMEKIGVGPRFADFLSNIHPDCMQNAYSGVGEILPKLVICRI